MMKKYPKSWYKYHRDHCRSVLHWSHIRGDGRDSERSRHRDTAAHGAVLLLKGWIASVVGGIGNLYGAIVGGFALGLVEQFGIWDLAGEWKDAISFVLLILFLSFWAERPSAEEVAAIMINMSGLRDAVELAQDPRRLWQTSRSNIQFWASLFIIAWAVGFMLWQGLGFAITVGTVFAIWAILAVGLNLVVGYTGLLSVGHIGFFGIGAYAMAILTSDPAYEQLRTEAIPTFGWPFFAALPVSVLLAGLVAIVVGVVFNRFRDDIYVLVSFGFAIIAFNVFLNWRSFTRGAFGIHEIARPKIGNWVLEGEIQFLIFVLVFLAIVMLIAWFIVSSSFWRVLTAIREDEDAIQVFGYQATHFKLAVGHIGDDGRARGRSVRELDELH